MWFQVLIPAPLLLIPILVMTTKGIQQPTKHDNVVNSDVIVTYSNHAEASDVRDKILVVTEKSIDTTMAVMVSKYEYSTERDKNTVKEGSEVEQPLQDDVIFVPNEQQEVVRNEEYLQRDHLNIHHMIGGHKTVQDILAERDVRVETGYKQVPVDSCKNIGHHLTQKPFSFMPAPRYKKPAQVNNTRRTSSSRRTMTISIDGQFCSHPCPVSCPEHYEPECAMSATGRHRVFVNHCTLDHNSCSFGVVWHKRPLSECVGGKKADMRQNAGFIDWMQRVGIVDKRGRLQLS